MNTKAANEQIVQGEILKVIFEAVTKIDLQKNTEYSLALSEIVGNLSEAYANLEEIE